MPLLQGGPLNHVLWHPKLPLYDSSPLSYCFSPISSIRLYEFWVRGLGSQLSPLGPTLELSLAWKIYWKKERSEWVCAPTELWTLKGKRAIPQRVSQCQNPGRTPAVCPGIIQVHRRTWGADISPGCSYFELCHPGGDRKAGCLGFGQASFVVFDKGITKTSNFISGRKF